MTIGIASPISTGAFGDYLNEESRGVCATLSVDSAPAVTTLARELLNLGHKQVTFTLDPKAKDEMMLEGDFLTIYVAPAQYQVRLIRPFQMLTGRNLRLIGRMFRFNQKKLDVLSVHWTREYAIAAKWYVGEIPVFVTVRDIMPVIIKDVKHDWHIYNWWIVYLMNEYVMRSKGLNFIANSEYTANMVNKFWGHDVPVIANPILDSYFDMGYCPEDEKNNIVLTTISSSSPDDPRKNILNLVKSFRKVRETNKNIVLNLIGPAFTENNCVLKKWADEGLMDGVRVHGPMKHDDVLKFLSHTHLMVHPSLEETFGNTLIEAMAVGCPVLGGDKSGAVPYVLNHGKAGYLCDVTSVESMANAIGRIVNSPQERLRRSREAKDYCYRNFSSREIANKYVQLFLSNVQ